jgi:predicted methyltransferase
MVWSGSRIGAVLAVALLFGAATPARAAEDAKLKAAIASPARQAVHSVRDAYRHPYETLTFFGLRDTMVVVEIAPGTGWWTEILAPYLRQNGKYYAAIPAPRADYQRDRLSALQKMINDDPTRYDRVINSQFDSDKFEIAPAGTADMVLTFRNLHNWIVDGTADGAMRAFYKALKPGGILGIEDHRADPAKPEAVMEKAGYVREDKIIAIAQKAGFVLAGKSEINANPKDTKDYPEGVWTLPPTYRLKDVDRAKYQAIGESDRATLSFVKPR